MAILELNGLSTALAGSFSATVIFPDCENMTQDKCYPALYFLHDIGGNDTDIRTVKNLQKLSNDLGLFVIAPSVMHSFGMDLPWGGKYGRFVWEELPGICRHLFPLDADRQYVGGTGGGAYGAVWNAANHPEAFRKCFVCNSHLDAAALCEAAASGAALPRLTRANLEAVFGELNAVRGSSMDLFAPDTPRPQALFLGCTEDFDAAVPGEKYAKQLKIPVHVGKTEEAIFEAGLRWLCQE